jgi:hypothetical protein
MWVARLDTRMASAEDPPSRTRRLIGNLEVAPLENGELQAKTAFLVHRSHLETGACGNRSRPLSGPFRRCRPLAGWMESGRKLYHHRSRQASAGLRRWLATIKGVPLVIRSEPTTTHPTRAAKPRITQSTGRR